MAEYYGRQIIDKYPSRMTGDLPGVPARDVPARAPIRPKRPTATVEMTTAEQPPQPVYYGAQSGAGYQTRTSGSSKDDATAKGTSASTTAPAPGGGMALKEDPLNPDPGPDPTREPGANPWNPLPYVPVMPGGPRVGGGSGGGGGTGGTGGGWGGGTGALPTGIGEPPGEEETPGGLTGYYDQKMNSQGMSDQEYRALTGSTWNAINQSENQARDRMMRARAATGNDAGLYGGLTQLSADSQMNRADASRKNFLANEEIKRQEQAQGAAGNLNLYGQTQAETMEYLRMLGNLLGRQDYIATSGSTSGGSAGIQWNPGGTQM